MIGLTAIFEIQRQKICSDEERQYGYVERERRENSQR